MPTFVHPLCGYALDSPDGWAWEEQGEVLAFGPDPQALNPTNPQQAAHFAIRPELNPYLRPIEPLWTEYITRVSIMKGAKKVGASPLKAGNLEGYESELLMPARQKRRLWVGLLAAGGVILHLMLTHPIEEKAVFQEPVSRMVQSLRFVAHTDNLTQNAAGVPLPPRYQPAAVESVLADTTADQGWEAFTGKAPIAALQAFYLRELPQHGWEITAYYPFPNREPAIRFASFVARQAATQAIVALVPHSSQPIRGHVAIHLSPLEES